MELAIKCDKFCSDNLKIRNYGKNSSFYTISYQTDFFQLESIILNTPWMDVPFGMCFARQRW